MSGIGAAFRTKLLSYSTVSTIVGQRMYADALKQNATLPSIVFYVTNTDRAHSVSGVTKFASARIVLECYGITRDAVSALSKAIRETGIDSFRGVVSDHTFCGVSFESGDEYQQEPPIDGSQVHRYICLFDCQVFYKEP